ncbi:16S rRNA (cytosine(1402)-N(4))-methyltransferase RsmH [Sphingobium lignivorans]|uniref:Ribosomal RNA small subunit methyltransferase H n=1 Tax=Sphingobium lignivorans TaxID=2735886 RepID=A0ABR6NBC1_9SPHN|nr:16S rRNA (cytosine(1402)-N(4))-methyltransferase RsmH [Sphingobium lignivorans]MBB5984582.1 16S rRNA (cytosine1402-N4)-methyltransferase [Sphingobium lignivorans]
MSAASPANPPAAQHRPVLLDEVLDALAIAPGEWHVDGTFGAGGYSSAMAGRGARVFAIDQDPDAIAEGQPVIAASEGAIRLVQGNFGEMDRLLAHEGVDAVDGVTLDIGVSSMQLDRPRRGFAFRFPDAPLDMRMNQSGETAAEFLNRVDETVLADILYTYGEERQSRRIARAIVAARPLATVGDLVGAVHRAIGRRPGDKTDPATRTFQAIRIHLNGELDALERGLDAAEAVLKPGGRLAIVTFHSLEDRIVKNFLRARSGQEGAGSRHRPEARAAQAPTFRKPARAVRPGEAEIAANPRARSATLRSAVRTAAPARISRQGADS